MPRGRKPKTKLEAQTIEEQIASCSIEIVNLKSQLKEKKMQLKELEGIKAEQDKQKMVEAISQKVGSVDNMLNIMETPAFAKLVEAQKKEETEKAESVTTVEENVESDIIE